jgi:Mg-chelatase subunit ChlD
MPSSQMEDVFKRYYESVVVENSDAKEMPKGITLCDDESTSAAPPPVPATHFVFVLDESGSMSGAPFDALRNAYATFLQDRQRARGLTTGQSRGTVCGDLVSVIMFNTGARVLYERQPLTSVALGLDFQGGGTSFSPALQSALNVMRGGAAHVSPSLIFMSDGADRWVSFTCFCCCISRCIPPVAPPAVAAPDVASIVAIVVVDSGGSAEMSQILSEFQSRGLQVHTVGFGSSPDETKLRELAVLGGGTFHAALSGADLIQTFREIAVVSTLQTKLVDKFGEQISKLVTNKLVLDYL